MASHEEQKINNSPLLTREDSKEKEKEKEPNQVDEVEAEKEAGKKSKEETEPEEEEIIEEDEDDEETKKKKQQRQGELERENDFEGDEVFWVTDDGGILKKLIKPGTGSPPQPSAKCVIHYVGRLLDGTVIDSSIERNQELTFLLGEGQVIAGIDGAVATMLKGEESLVRVTCDYGYGFLGCPPRIPNNAIIFYRITLLHFENKDLLPVKPETFQDRIDQCLKAKEEGNEFFKKSAWRKASKAYNKGLSLFNGLECTASEEEEMNALKVPLFLNLAACHLKLDDQTKAIQTLLKVIELDDKNVKAHYRLGQAYSRNMDFDQAKLSFATAKQLDPSLNLTNEFKELNNNVQKYKQEQKRMYQKIFSK